MKKVMAFGTFDVLHPGHEFFLSEAKKLGDYLVVVVGRDETVSEVKKKSPRNNENIRLEQVKKLHIADEVLLGRTGDKYSIIRDVSPSVIALGYDQTFFTENLQAIVGTTVEIVRLESFKPKVYKSSKFCS